MIDTYTKQGSLMGAELLKTLGASVAGAIGVKSVPELASKIRNLTPTGRALQEARAARAMANPSASKLLEMSQNLGALGMNAQDAASTAKAYESMMKVQQSHHELQQANSLLGRLSRTTGGQLAIPVIAMGAVTAGAMGANKAMSVLGAAGINVDPSARLAAKVGVDRIIRAKPALANYPRAQVERVYEMIFRHSPDLAQDPFTMADAVERALQMGGSDTSYLRELSDYQRAAAEQESRQAGLYSMGSNLVRR